LALVRSHVALNSDLIVILLFNNHSDELGDLVAVRMVDYVFLLQSG
jgi:hypothetical protein